MDEIVLVLDTGREIALNAVFCEITGEQVCWATIPPEGCTPAYISFSVVNNEGAQQWFNLQSNNCF